MMLSDVCLSDVCLTSVAYIFAADRPAGMARIGSSGRARLGRHDSRLPLRASVAGGGGILWRPSAS